MSTFFYAWLESIRRDLATSYIKKKKKKRVPGNVVQNITLRAAVD